MEKTIKWVRKNYNKIIHSIAFVPALMAVIFILIAIVTMEMDAAGIGKQLNEKIKWLTLKDAETARSIVSTIAAGIISLTVFSFSMVMIVMNQAASHLSNRTLDNLIGNKFQKIVLGFYIGTIIYALFLLSNISESQQENSVPTLSIYILTFFSIVNIFLFVYFLHYITQSIIYEQIIKRIYLRTKVSFKSFIYKEEDANVKAIPPEGEVILSSQSGYFQGFNEKQLIKLAVEKDIVIRFLHSESSYVLKDTPFMIISSKSKLDKACLKKIFLDIDFYYGQEIDKNPYFGFHHLMEIAVKALSPGINDPGTAIISLHSLTDLLAYKLKKIIPPVLTCKNGIPRIFTKAKSFDELFQESVLPIWDYGKTDRLVIKAMLKMLEHLSYIDKQKKHSKLFTSFKEEVITQKEKLSF